MFRNHGLCPQGFTSGQFSANLQGTQCQQNQRSQGCGQLKWFEKPKHLLSTNQTPYQKWSGIPISNQRMLHQWAGTGSSGKLTQGFQKQGCRSNSDKNRYTSIGGSCQYSSNCFGTGDQFSNPRQNIGQSANDKDECMRNMINHAPTEHDDLLRSHQHAKNSRKEYSKVKNVGNWSQLNKSEVCNSSVNKNKYRYKNVYTAKKFTTNSEKSMKQFTIDSGKESLKQNKCLVDGASDFNWKQKQDESLRCAMEKGNKLSARTDNWCSYRIGQDGSATVNQECGKTKTSCEMISNNFDDSAVIPDIQQLSTVDTFGPKGVNLSTKEAVSTINMNESQISQLIKKPAHGYQNYNKPNAFRIDTAKNIGCENESFSVSSESSFTRLNDQVNLLSEQVKIKRSNVNLVSPDDSNVEVKQGNKYNANSDNGVSKIETTKELNKHVPQYDNSKDLSNGQCISHGTLQIVNQAVIESSIGRMDTGTSTIYANAEADMKRYNNLDLKPSTERAEGYSKLVKLGTNYKVNEDIQNVEIKKILSGGSEAFGTSVQNESDVIGRHKNHENKATIIFDKERWWCESKENMKRDETYTKHENKHYYLDAKINREKEFDCDKDCRKNTQKYKCNRSNKFDHNLTCNEKRTITAQEVEAENLLCRMNPFGIEDFFKRRLEQKEFINHKRLPFSPNQNMNKQANSKRVTFNDSVIAIGKDGKMSKKMIDDSKPYRLEISLFEKRKKMMKSKQKKIHVRSDITLKQKGGTECKQIINHNNHDYYNHVPMFKGFKIPKHHKDGKSLEDSKVKFKLARKNVSENVKKSKVSQCHEQNSNSNIQAKLLNTIGEKKTESVRSTMESLQPKEKSVVEFKKELKKRKLFESANVSSVSDTTKDVPMKKRKVSKDIDNTNNFEETSQKNSETLVSKHVSGVKTQGDGSQNLIEFSGGLKSSNEMETKNHVKENKYGLEKAKSNKIFQRSGKKNMKFLEHIVKEKLSNYKKGSKSKFERIKDYDHVSKGKTTPRLTEGDVKQALRAVTCQTHSTCDKMNMVEKNGKESKVKTSFENKRQNAPTNSKNEMKADQSINWKSEKAFPVNKTIKLTHPRRVFGKEMKELKQRNSKASKSLIDSDATIISRNTIETKSSGVQLNLKEKLVKKSNIKSTDQLRSPGLIVGSKAAVKNVHKTKQTNRKENNNKQTKSSEDENYVDNSIIKKKTTKSNDHLNDHIKEINNIMSEPNAEANKRISNRRALQTNMSPLNMAKRTTGNKNVSSLANVVDSTSEFEKVNEREVLMSQKGNSADRMLLLSKKRRMVEENVNVFHKVTLNTNSDFSYQSINFREKYPCNRKSNMLEKKSLGYTAPDVKRKTNSGTNTLHQNSHESSFVNAKTVIEEKFVNNKTKHLKTASEIVRTKVSDLRKKSETLIPKHLEHDKLVTSKNTVSINRNYCTGSKLDGDKVTSHLLRADTMKEIEISSKVDTVSKVQNLTGLPISVLNTRTHTVKTYEDYQEINTDELGCLEKFTEPCRFSDSEDFSLPEHNICQGNIRISDKTPLFAKTLQTDLVSFGTSRQCPTFEKLSNSNQARTVSVGTGNTGNRSVELDRTQLPRKSNLSWEEIFPVPDHYVRLKNILEGLATNEVEDDAYAVGGSNCAKQLPFAADSNEVRMLQDANYQDTYSGNDTSTCSDTWQEPLSNGLQQMKWCPNDCLSEGPYQAYPLGKVSDFNPYVRENQFPFQATNSSLNDRGNYTQTGHFSSVVPYHLSNEIWTHYNTDTSTSNYQQNSSLFPRKPNMFEFSHGSQSSYPMQGNDYRSSHVSNSNQSYDWAFNSQFYNRNQKESFCRKNTFPAYPQLIQNPAHSFHGNSRSGWNPEVPIMDTSLDGTHKSKTSVYMQSLIVQHSDSSENNRSGREAREPVENPTKIYQNRSAEECQDFCEYSVLPAEQLERGSFRDKQATVRRSESKMANIQGHSQKNRMNILKNEKNCTDRLETDIVSHPGVSTIDEKDEMQSTTEIVPLSESKGNTNEKLQKGSMLEPQANCDLSVSKEAHALPNLGGESAKCSDGTTTGMILDECTGDFKRVDIPFKTDMSPRFDTDHVLPDQMKNCNSRQSTCNKRMAGTLSDCIVNCNVDPRVKESIKFPLVTLSPLKMTKEMEVMIDDYIAKNSTSIFNSSWLPLIQSPVWSIRTPSISPRNTPMIAVSNGSPPVLSPIQTQKMCETISEEKTKMPEIIYTKKKVERRSKTLKGILPSRQYETEKTLYATAEKFLGKDFPKMSSRKRKNTEQIKYQDMDKPKKVAIQREKLIKAEKERTMIIKGPEELNTVLDRPIAEKRVDKKSVECSKDSEEAIAGVERLVQANCTEVETFHDKSEVNAEVFFTVNDSKQEFEQEKSVSVFKEKEGYNEQISLEKEIELEESPLLRRLQSKSKKKLKYTEEEKEVETKNVDTKDKFNDTQDEEEHLCSSGAENDKKQNCEKPMIAKKRIKRPEFHKHCLRSAVESRQRMNKKCGHSSKCYQEQQSEFAVSNDDCSALSNGTEKRNKRKKSILYRDNLKQVDQKIDKSVCEDVTFDSELDIPNKIADAHDSKIVIAKKDRQWSVCISRLKKRTKKRSNLINEVLDFKSKACAVLGKGQRNSSKAKMKSSKSLSNRKDEELSDGETNKDDISRSSDKVIKEKDVSKTNKEFDSSRKRKQKRPKDIVSIKAQHHEFGFDKSIQKKDINHKIGSDVQADKATATDKVMESEKVKRLVKGRKESEKKKRLTVLRKGENTCRRNKKYIEITESGVKKKQNTCKGPEGCRTPNASVEIETAEQNNINSNSKEMCEGSVRVKKERMKLNGHNSDFQNTKTLFRSPKISKQAKTCKNKKISNKKSQSVEKNVVLRNDVKGITKKNDKKYQVTKQKKIKLNGKANRNSKTKMPIKSIAKTDTEKLPKKGDTLLKCLICSENFTTRRLLNAHIPSFHPYRCTWCKIEFDTKEESKEHYFTHMKNTYSCSTCNVKYGNLATYGQHLKSKKHEQMLGKSGKLEINGLSVNVLDQQRTNQAALTDQTHLVKLENMMNSVEQQMPVNTVKNMMSHVEQQMPVNTVENMMSHVEQQMPGDTVTQFYSSLQENQEMWCNFKVSNNIVELQYNQPDHNVYGNYGNRMVTHSDMTPNFADQNGNFINNSSLNEAAIKQVYDFELLDTDQKVIDNNSTFIENGKEYTEMTDVKIPHSQNVNHLLTESNHGYTEMTDDEFGQMEQDNETTALCRIANSFSLSSLGQEDKNQ